MISYIATKLIDLVLKKKQEVVILCIWSVKVILS